MRRKRTIPNKPNFNRAIKRAYEFLLELNIQEFPIDPFKIIDLFSDTWFVESWSELKSTTNNKDPFNLKRDKAEAKTQIERGTNQYMIVYDDSFSKDRITFTLAHEIGHILLGHLIYYEETSLNRGGLNEKQYKVLETEANWFANRFLAPQPTLKFYNRVTSKEIALLCSTSKESSEISEKQLKDYNFEFRDSEKQLARNFFNFFYYDQDNEAIKEGIYRFYGGYLYDDFFKICRVCRDCNAYITDNNQSYCHICGAIAPEWDLPYGQLPENGFWVGWPGNLKGKFYPYIHVNIDNKVLFCPVCNNHEVSAESSFCKICGTPLYNSCLNESKSVNGKCRYCPDCGEETKFNKLNVFDNLIKTELPELLGTKYEDYIEYEYWEYIIATTFHFKKTLDLYTALSGSKAIRDGNSIVVFVKEALAVAIVLTYKDLLKECIRDFGLIDIERIDVIYDL